MATLRSISDLVRHLHGGAGQTMDEAFRVRSLRQVRDRLQPESISPPETQFFKKMLFEILEKVQLFPQFFSAVQFLCGLWPAIYLNVSKTKRFYEGNVILDQLVVFS
jgi:hypothetical protein